MPGSLFRRTLGDTTDVFAKEASSQLGTAHPEKAPKLLSQTACKSALKWERASERPTPARLPAACCVTEEI